MAPDPSIYEYDDFREYLKDWFTARAGRPSQNGFARKVPCSSSLLSSVIGGSRNLGRARVERFSDVLKLDADARDYFLVLVDLDEAESPADRERARRRISARRKWDRTAGLNEAAFQVFSNWLYPVLFEMCRWPDFQADATWIAERIRPRVSEDDVRPALAWLEEQGLIGELAAEGQEIIGDRLSTGHEELNRVRGALLASYHETVLDMVKQRLTETDRSARHYTTMTFAADAAGVDRVKREIRRVVEEASAASVSCEDPDRVMVLAIQLVPTACDPAVTELNGAK